MPPTVRLAGFNVDADLLRDTLDFLQDVERDPSWAATGQTSGAESSARAEAAATHLRTALSPEAFTPETISAAYARISRDPRHVSELRRAARFGVARARKSNETIIFGLGHASVAEHACFNFDVSGLSRLACEELQAHRLLSFTEKSQRYVTLTTDYIVPPELAGTAWEERFRRLIPVAFTQYEALCSRLTEHHLKQRPSSTPEGIREIENRSKEDARYLLPLACATQMGLTANARNIEYVLRDFSDHPLREVRELGNALHEAVAGLAPSLVKYTRRGDYPRANREVLTMRSSQAAAPPQPIVFAPSVQLVDSSPDGEERIRRALAFTAGTPDVEAVSWREIFRNMTVHDSVPREFEVASLTFEAIVSASCFAQLKRHRMMTLLPQPYSSNMGFIVPPSIHEAGLDEPFATALQTMASHAAELCCEHPPLAPYLLTNAHRRRVLICMNARELYHFVRLRSDRHAQWEIRSLSDQMLDHARRLWPNVCALACGKDMFDEVYRSRYPD